MNTKLPRSVHIGDIVLIRVPGRKEHKHIVVGESRDGLCWWTRGLDSKECSREAVSKKYCTRMDAA